MLISHATNNHINSSSKIRTDRDRPSSIAQSARSPTAVAVAADAPLVPLARVAPAASADALGPAVPLSDDASDDRAGALIAASEPEFEYEAALTLSMGSLATSCSTDDEDEVEVSRSQKRGDRLVRSLASPPSDTNPTTPPLYSTTAATTIASTSGGTRSTSATSSSSGEDGLVPVKLLPFRHVTDYTQPEDRPLETYDVWVIDSLAKYTNLIFDFLRKRQFSQSELHHLKRVKRVDETRVSIIVHTVDPPPPADLSTLFASDPSVSNLGLVPYIHAVPTSHGSTLQQVATWSELWPVTYIPLRFGARAVLRIKGWPQARIDWIHAQLDSVWAAAQAAADKGELPIACSVSPSWDTTIHSDVNRPRELVSAHDTRLSTGHPLTHAFRNLIGEVAALDRLGLRREDGVPCVPPPPPPRSLSGTTLPNLVREEDKGTRPAVPALPYLLTSMTVFASHEPCLLCSMSLLHSRVRTIFYIAPAPHSGGCGSVYSTHEDEKLNHHFDVWTVDPEQYPPIKMRTTQLPGHVFVRTLDVDP